MPMSSNPSGAPAVLVIGTGMYVCGRNTDGFGTVLPVLAGAKATGLVRDIYVAGTSAEGIEIAQGKLAGLNARLGTRVEIKGFPDKDDGRNPFAYRKALSEIPRPACAIVVVPDHLHAAVAEDVIRAGLHLLVVKPLAPTLPEARRMVDLAKAHHVYGAVEFHKRYDEANLILRQVIADGRLGRLRYITVEYSQRRGIRGVFKSWIQHTNVFQYLGVHYVDLVYFATGARPLRVLATGQPSSLAAKPGGLDAIQAVVEWKDGKGEDSFVSTIMTNWIDPDRSSAMSDQRITMVGTLGRYESDQKNRGVQLVTESDGVEDINPYFTQCYTDTTGDVGVQGYGPRSIRQFLTDVGDLIHGKCEPEELVATRPSFQDALVSTAVIDAASKSLSRGGEWITIDGTALGVCSSQ